MDEILNKIIKAGSLGCLAVATLLGGFDNFLKAFTLLVVVDYLTGVALAIKEHRLSSAIGFRGICRKVFMYALIAVGYCVDAVLVGEPVIRTIIILFYIANEGISILENMAQFGLPIPSKLRKVFETLKEKSESED